MEREMKRLGVFDTLSFETISRWFSYDKVDEFFAAVGEGDIHGASIANRILEMERREEEQKADILKTRPAAVSVDISNGVNIMGTGGLLVNLARCCKPAPGDKIVGFVTRGRGVTVHRSDCPNVGMENERLIEVTWGKSSQEQRYSVAIEIVAYDREGLMLDISTVMADEKVNMSSVNVAVRSNIATFNLIIEITDMQKLTRILTRLESIASVTEARRRYVH
jgi:GTP pyrophosphokinase